MPFLLVLKQPDLGSAIVFIGIFFAMLFWAGVRPRLLFLLASPGLSLLLAFNNWAWGVWIVVFVADPDRLASLYLGLALVFWFAECGDGGHRDAALEPARALPAEPAAHLPQSRGGSRGPRATTPSSRGWPSARAAGSGPATPRAPRSGWRFLPEQHTDFVFSVVGEELGFVGVLVALGSSWRCSWSCSGSPGGRPTPSAASSVFGILGLFFTHVFENVGMTVNLMPITGIPLPFFSYGGSFFIICSLCLGWPSGWHGTRDRRAILMSDNDLAEQGLAREAGIVEIPWASDAVTVPLHSADYLLLYGRDGMV